MSAHGNRKIGRQDLALAYELRAEGVYWKIIAWGLGIDRSYLHQLIRKCEREGLGWLPEVDCG